MLTITIALLVSLGVYTSADFENATEQEKQEMIESQDIIITDVLSF